MAHGEVAEPAIPHARWNFFVLAADFALFSAGLSFMSWVTIFPAFLKELGASNVEIGLISVVTATGFALPPVFVARYTQRLRRKSPFVLLWTVWERLPSGILALLALLAARSHPTLTLWLAIGLVALQTTVGGFLTSAWLDMIARAVATRSRGRFFGWSSAAAGALGFLGSLLSQRLLDRLGFPDGYAACFALACVCFMVSYVFLALNKEVFPAGASEPPPASIGYLRELSSVLRGHKDFTRFLAARCLSAFSGAASGFYTVVAISTVAEAASNVGLLTAWLLAATTVANSLWGGVADRAGHKVTLVLGQALTTVSLAVVIGSRSLPEFGLAFVLLGLGTSAINISAYPMTLEFAPQQRRPTYIGLVSVSNVPFVIAGPLLGGLMADHLGYAPAMAMYLLFGLEALALMVVAVRDPRRAVRHELA